MADEASEVQHVHGVPISEEPQSVKELFLWVKARFEALESVAGPTGPMGPQGPAGPQGETGPQGPAGVAVLQ